MRHNVLQIGLVKFKDMKTPTELVKEYYPNALPINIGTKKGGNYYHIMSEKENGIYLGKGKSKKAAWIAAYRHGL